MIYLSVKKEECIFIYIIADNYLDYFAVSNINQMEEAFLNTFH